MIAFDFIDEHFSKAKAPQCELSILIGMDSLCYLISDPDRKALLVRRYDYRQAIPHFQRLVGPVQEILASDNLLSQHYRTTRIGLLDTRATLVPDRLFNERNKASYLRNMVPEASGDRIFANPLPGLQSVLVYALPGDLLDAVKKPLAAGTIQHVASGQLNLFHRLGESQAGKHLYVNVRKHLLQAVLMDGPNLLVYNTFEYSSSRDFVYYILLLYDQFELATDEIPVHLSGYIVENSEIFQLLYRYVKDVQRVKVQKHLQIPAGLRNQAHMYLDLFSLVPVPVKT